MAKIVFIARFMRRGRALRQEETMPDPRDTVWIQSGARQEQPARRLHLYEVCRFDITALTNDQP
ncbi:hypothetical protein [Mesorhizobium sp. J428]|uniref:hypothetical protein n=1 Tax=Mesorhizobium sp. J428 TaxID=2898440 RepID=UPI0021517EC3|nr:hypothetical protein [Mesorhizobium sp. J428]MCR5859074.1 hypothetical protein [Mesorhizobium sp. J428]